MGCCMQDLMVILLTWIGAHSSYNVDLVLPNVAMTNSYNICVNYGINNKGQCEAARLKGFYNKNLTIYLPNDFDPQDPVDRSRLIHELVHYVQWANNKQKTTCLGHLEVEAYELQDQWRLAHNLTESLDPFRRIMFEASCDA
jgi:hypothetical protein